MRARVWTDRAIQARGAPVLVYRSAGHDVQPEEIALIQIALIQRWLAVALFLGLALPAFGAEAPPSIDDLNGSTFSVRAKGPEFDLAGMKFKADTTIEWTITKTSENTVAFDSVFGGMLFSAYYVDGFLLQATSSGETPPQEGSSMYLAVSGKPGKLKLKGALTVYAAGPGFNVLRVLKVSGKQI